MYKGCMLNISKDWKDEQLYFDTEEEMKEWIRNNKKEYTINSAFKLTQISIADCF
jgi:predicted GIY-YIG superfamily endonuclease